MKRERDCTLIHLPIPLAAQLAALLLLGCAPALTGPQGPATASSALTVAGKVSVGGSGVPGADVQLLALDFYQSPAPEPLASARSGADGSFVLTAPQGSYLLLARRGDTFSFFGRNPIRLAQPVAGVNLPLVPVHPPRWEAVAEREEEIRGRALLDGAPLEGAQVAAYRDTVRGFRGPASAVSPPTDASGRYNISVPPGTYFLVARSRPQGWRIGEMGPGDRYGVFPTLPLVLDPGEAVEANIETIELPSQEQMDRYRDRSSTLAGQIVSRSGRPLAGMRACLYNNPGMLNQPLAVSEPTGPDGRFVLKTRASGHLFLGAREWLGSPPDMQERVGVYQGPQGSALPLAPGQKFTGLHVVVGNAP